MKRMDAIKIKIVGLHHPFQSLISQETDRRQLSAHEPGVRVFQKVHGRVLKYGKVFVNIEAL